MTELHLEVLGEEQRALLRGLGEFAASQGFYLGGGTAVALQLGHRCSDDFDWFHSADIADPLVLAQQLRERGFAVEEVQIAAGTLHAVIEAVRVSFLEYPYPLLSAPGQWSDPSLTLASLDDLAPMKLAAAAQRGSRKDFADLYAIMQQGRPLADLLELYCRKYATNDTAHVLKALTYFDAAEAEPPLSMLWNVSWEEMRRSLEAWVKALTR